MIPFEIKPIPDMLGYGASTDGRIWSQWKWGRRELTDKWREITLAKKKDSEYRLAHIGPVRNQKTYQVHRLVAAAFFGPIPEGMVVDHINCDKSNNAPENLEIVTREENERRAFQMGRKFKGEMHPNSKYSIDQIRQVKAEAALGGSTQKEIAIKCGVGLKTVVQVLSGRQWSHA